MKSLLQRHQTLAGALVLALIVGLSLGFVPWQAPDAWRQAMMRRLSVSLGAPDLTAGEARFALLPAPRLTLSSVSFAQEGGGISARADEAVVRLNVLDLLAGRVRPTDLTLRQPDIAIRLASPREKGFRGFVETVSHLGGAVLLGQASARLPSLGIDGGRIALTLGSDAPTLFEDAHLRLDLPSLREPMAVTFRARQGQSETAFSFSGATPVRVVARTAEPVALSYTGHGLKVTFDGEGILSSTPSMRGRLAVTSTAGALAALGMAVSEQPAARVSLRSLLDYSARGANLAELAVVLGPDRYDGAGSVRHDGQRWHLSGTLATEKANLSAPLSVLRDWRKQDGQWNDESLSIDSLFANTIDIRVSAEQLTVFDRTLKKVALSVLTRPNKAEFSVGDALWHEGAFRLKASATPGSFGIDVKVAGTLDKADIGAVLGGFVRDKRISGQGNATVTLETSGRSIAQFITNGSGRAALMVRGGALHGIDLNRLASRRGARGDLALTEALGGTTPFETASLAATLSNGAAQSVDGHLRAGRLVGTLQGGIDFGQARHDLSGSVIQTPADTQRAEPATVLDFTISGPLFEPRITPNVAALLKRS